MRIARGVVSGIPLVGGVVAEGMGPAVDAARSKADAEQQKSNPATQELKDIVLATGALGPGLTLKNSYNVSSFTDMGIGAYTITLAVDAADDDYLVLAQAPGAIVDVPSQNAGSFTLSIRDQRDPTRMIDAPVKFLVLKASI